MLLLAAGQNGFKMGRLLLAGDDVDFDSFESGCFEPALQIALGEAQPSVAIELMGLLEAVPGQIQDHDLSAGSEGPVRAEQRPGRLLGVVQGLAQDDQIRALRLF